MQSSFDYFVAKYLGYDPSMYDASFYEWSKKDLPAETSPKIKHGNRNALALQTRAFSSFQDRLEQVPQELVVDIVVVLDLGGLDERSQQARAAIGRGLFQIGVALFTSSPKSLVVHSALLKLSIAV